MKTFLACILGIVVCFFTIFLLEMVGMKVFPIKQKVDPKNFEALRTMMYHIPIQALITVAIGHGLGLFLGIFVGFKIQPKSIVPFLLIFLLVLIATISNLAMFPHPMWFMVTDVSILVIVALFSWRLFKWN